MTEYALEVAIRKVIDQIANQHAEIEDLKCIVNDLRLEIEEMGDNLSELQKEKSNDPTFI